MQSNKSKVKQPPLFFLFLKNIARNSNKMALRILVMIFFRGLFEGVGLFLLFPLLYLIGLGGEGPPQGVAAYMVNILSFFGIPMTLVSVLAVYFILVSIAALIQQDLSVTGSKITNNFPLVWQAILYRKLVGISWLSYTKMRKAELPYIFNNVVPLLGTAANDLVQLAAQMCLIVVYLAVSVRVSIPFTSLAVGIGFILLIVLKPLNKKAQATGRNILKNRGRVFETLSDHLDGLKVVKSYGIEKEHSNRFAKSAREAANQMILFSKVHSRSRSQYQMGAAFALCLMTYIAITFFKVSGDKLLIATFLFSRILPKLSTAQQHYQRIRQALPSYGAVLEMDEKLETCQETAEERDAKPMEIVRGVSIDKVKFTYDPESNDAPALADINLFIPAKKITAFVGPSGAGKSTLADLLLGLLAPDQGKITIDDNLLAGQMLFDWRKSVGYVPQETFLFNDTVRANLMWAHREATEDDLWNALRAAAAADFVSNLPQKLETVLGEGGVRLSGGERQRIALARALLRKPAMLLLDEATSHLDAFNERLVQEAVEGLGGKLTIVIIAHRLSTIRRADQIVVLDKGRIVESGAWDELAGVPGGHFNILLKENRLTGE